MQNIIKKSIYLLINQATMIYWALIHLFVTAIPCIASGCDKWSGLFFGEEKLFNNSYSGDLPDTCIFAPMATQSLQIGGKCVVLKLPNFLNV